MAFEYIPMNLDALNNITAPNISIGVNIVEDIVVKSNYYTNDLIIFASMFIVGVILYLILTDNTQFQDFGYDYIRGLNISLASITLLSMNLVELGFSPNFYAVGLFTTLWFLSGIGILVIENQE